MSDASTDTGASPATSDSPAGANAGGGQSSSPAVSPPPVETAGGGDDPFSDLPADQAIFPRSYVEKLRTEGHKYRTEAQSAAQKAAEYDQVYGIYDDADRQVWFDLARTWAVDPARAAEAMNAIARSVLDEGKQSDSGGETGQATTVEDIAEQSGLTPEQVQAMISDALGARDQQAAQAQAVQDIFDEVRTRGYDPETREGFMVLWTANNETDGDLDAAVDRIKQYKQGIIDEYVAGRSGTPAPTLPNGGVAANQNVEITTFEEARKATDQFLRGQRAAGT
jgi:hypothetical protein